MHAFEDLLRLIVKRDGKFLVTREPEQPYVRMRIIFGSKTADQLTVEHFVADEVVDSAICEIGGLTLETMIRKIEYYEQEKSAS